MKYSFLKFTLDTETKELYANNQPLLITKLQYDLLLFLLQNPNKMFTKKDILDTLWAGKHVTENSIDQIISKLRKILSSVEKDSYIKTVYGKGLMFVPEVSLRQKQQTKVHKQTRRLHPKVLLLLALMAVIIGVIFTYMPSSPEPQAPSLLLIMSSNDDKSSHLENKDWLNQAPSSFVNQLFNYANIAQLKDYKNKPEHLDRQQYINSQWRLSPNLKVVNIHVFQKDNLSTVELQVFDKNTLRLKQTFTEYNLARALLSASKWLAKTTGNPTDIKQLESLFPQSSHVIELYLRGITSLNKGEIDKAEQYLQLCLTQDPNFKIAHLQLAHAKNAQGKQDKALAILDTLSESQLTPALEIAIATLRGDIYDTQGKYQQARELYLNILKKYQDQILLALNEVRYNLSFTYAILTQYQQALSELDTLEQNLKGSENPELLAHVYQKKASLLQKLGHLQQAQEAANKSLTLFSKLDDLLGEAKIYITLARISTHKSEYKKSVQFLEQALVINQSLNYKLGVGATINELIYVLMVQGNFDKAWELNQKMQDIALEINYNAMLQIAKQYAVDISRALKKWKRAELYLQEHAELAQASGNKRALLKNKLLALDLYLDQNKIEKIEPLLEQIQQHIDKTGEVRLQPRLNKQLAQYYFLTNKYEQAIALLLSSKELAKKSEDGETIIEINNALAKHYIQNKQAQKALAILEESNKYEPLPYPFLLLKAKAYHALGNHLLALELGNECKNSANQWWSLEDERFLHQLQQGVSQQPH